MNLPRFFYSPLAYGVCSDCSANSSKATMLLEILEPHIKNCDMPDCHEVAVRVGVFDILKGEKKDKPVCEFRGLCERHKRTGMWNNDGGWQL